MWYEILSIIAIAFLSLMLILALFEPYLEYNITRALDVPIDSQEFLCIVAALANAQIHHHNRVEVLTNGEIYYAEELKAIGQAKHHVNLEAYIFQKGDIANRFLEALIERAQLGVQVNLILDALGSFATWNHYLKPLIEAGGKVGWYHPITLYNLPRFNNRTHREIIIIDGVLGFVGGSGIADHWYKSRKGKRRWRDTMVRIEGSAITSLQSTFVENWVEATGEILTGKEYFPLCEKVGEVNSLVVNSTPSIGRSTRARILFQTLLASAQQSIHITSPYFLPDAGVRKELARALKERGVEVKIVVPGKHSDHLLTRRSSRRLYGQILNAGGEIYEYEPGMIHAKCLIIDGVWSVVGSTNFDHRSFGINDEVNVACNQVKLAARLEEDFARDVADSKLITYKKWAARSLFERAHEWLGSLLERQQ
ncbi:MAG: cardiolipin synthase B [Acidobacteria bacterium]|nr:cardiolipin synthase B [Acidobacteriota bacterium]